jgi:hypothetical protein
MRFGTRRSWLLGTFVACALLAVASAAEASILGSTWQCTSYGAFDRTARTSWAAATEDGLPVYDVQFDGGESSGTGYLATSFQTDSSLDPTLHYLEGAINDSGPAWIGYDVSVTVNTPLLSPLTPGSYSLSAPAVSDPGDWTATITQPLTYEGVVGGQNEYVGTIVYAGGTQIGAGDELDYGYHLSFAGSTQYQAIQEANPVFTPEPGTLALLAAGLLALVVGRRKLFA